MRQFCYQFFLLVILTILSTWGSKAQTTIPVDLSANPDSIWSITNLSRGAPDCLGAGSDCIKFNVTVNSQSAHIGFNVATPAPPGGATYQLDCGTPTSLGTPLCVSGLTTFSILFCKSGNDQPTYTISASRGYLTSADLTLRADGSCPGQMGVQGLQEATVTWTSIYPGVAGAYNSYLSCTSACDTISVTPTTGAPSYIDYKVCGTASGCTSGSICDTIRVYTYPALTVAISPANPSTCSGGPTSTTLTATPTGGSAPYTYTWTGPGSFTSAAQSPTVTTPGTYTVSVTDNTNCLPVIKTVMVTAYSTPAVTSVSSRSTCSNTAQNYTMTSGVSGTTYSWSRALATGVSNAAVTAQTANPITETLINTTSSPVNVTYTIIPTANGCTGAAFTYTVTVNPTPTVTGAVSGSICSGTSQNYTITSGVSGTTYLWSRVSVAGVSNTAVTAQTSNPITEALINTTSSPVNVTYAITPTANSCAGPAFTYTVTVNPTPTVTSAASASICNSTAQNYAITSGVSGTAYSWSRALVAGVSNTALTAQTSNPITETLINTTSSSVNVTYTISPTANGCTGPAFTYTVTVNPTSTVTSAASGSICSSTAQNYTITSGVSGTTYLWSRASVSGVSNTALTAQTSNPITEALINTTSSPVNVTYTITPTANSCTGSAFTYTVTVNPTPTVTSVASASICNSTAQNYTITSGVSGTTYLWSRALVAGVSNTAVTAQSSNPITEVLINTTSSPVNAIYIITPTANSCPGTAFTYTVTVKPTPTVTSVASASICNSTAQNYTITSGVSGTTYLWSRASVAGVSNTALTAQTSNPITEALVNTTSSPVNVTYVITPTANGCTGPDFNYTVTVNPTPTVTSAASDVICNNTAQNYTITSGVSGATYSWSRALIAGVSNTAVTAQTANPITEALINTTSSPVNVTYTIIPTANGCTGPAFTFTVTVNPTPTVTSAASASICNSTAQNYTITSGVSGTTYSWSRGSVAGISNTAVTAQTANPITEALINTTSSPVNVTYTITPTANGCTGPDFTYAVTVNPTPTATSAASASICNGTAQNYTITSGVSGTTYSWSRALVTGVSNTAVTAQTSNPITEALNNTTSSPVNVTYIITPTANGCTGPAFTYTVTVNPTPTVTSVASGSICSGTAQNYTITSGVSGTTYSWSRASVAGVSNTAVTAQTSNPITETLVNTTSLPVNVTYTITPTANGCTGPAFTYTVTVNPTPTVTSAASASICNSTAQNYTITSGVSGTTYSWGRASVTGISNTVVTAQISNPIAETLNNTTSSPVNVTYVIIPTANGCAGPDFNHTVTVDPTPTVTSAASDVLCNEVMQSYSITSDVSGTSYSWSRALVPGVSNAAVTAQSANPITETLSNTTTSPVNVTYTITPTANGCTGPDFNYVVTINPTPTPIITSVATAVTCSEVEHNYLITSGVSGVTYNWSRASVAGISNAAATGQTSNPITETLINITDSPINETYIIIPAANGCTGSAFNYTITVNPTPTVTSAASGSICSSTAQNYTITSGVSGATYLWSRASVAGVSNTAVSAQTSNPITETLVNTTSSPVNVTYTITPTANGCTGPAFTYTVTVNPTPTVTSAASGSICSGTAQNYTITSGVSGTTYSWSRAQVTGISNAAVTAQTSNPVTEALNNTTSSPVNVTYIITPTANGCTGPAFTYTVTVNPTPTVISVASGSICSGTAQNYAITGGVSGTTYLWSRASVAGVSNTAVTAQTSNPVTETLNNTTSSPVSVTYVITPTANGCAGPDFNYTATVKPTPIVTSAASDVICNEVMQSYSITSDVSGTTYNWSRASVPGVSNAAVTAQSANPITETLSNTTTSPVNVTYIITPTADGCTGPDFNYIVTINPTPAPIITSATTATICSEVEHNYLITSGVSGVTYNWSRASVAGISNIPATGQTSNPITETLINTTASPINETYIIIPAANGCTGSAFNYTITVNPTPTVTSSALGNICSSTAQNYAVTSDVSGTTYSWSRASVTGISNAPVSAQSTNPINESLINTTSSPVNVTYIITPTANGCTGPAFTYTVTVNPTPTVTSAASASICNSTVQNYTITSGVSATTYSWSRPMVTGISNTAITVQTSNPITETLNNTTSSSVNVTYVITPIANGCTGPDFIYTVTVKPTPVITSVSSTSICNSTAQNYSFTSDVSGATFSWSRTSVAGISNTTVTAQTVNPIAEILVNTTSSPVDVTYIITPTANGCTGPDFNYTVTVNPTPTVTSAASDVICSNTAQNYTITSDVSGTTYSWSRVSVASISNTAATGQTTNPITETLINTNSSPINVTYIITPTANACTGPAFTYTITVNPTPTVTSAAAASICNSAAQNYTITGGVNGTTYSWSRDLVTGISNAAAMAQISNPITETLINTTSSPVNVTYVIIPTANGCAGPDFNYTLTVNPTPTVTSADSGAICNNLAQNYSITSDVSGTTYSWSRASVAGIGNAAVSTQSASPITETLINTTSSPVNVTYIITPTTNGCTGPAFTYTVTVNPTPTVTSLASDAICSNTAQNYAIASDVNGTTYSWTRALITGISNAAVTAQTSNLIAETLINTTSSPVNVTYVITPTANGCTGSDFNYTVTVNPTPTVTSPASDAICNDVAQNYSITGNVIGTTYLWSRSLVTGINNTAVSTQSVNSITETLTNTTSSPVDVTYVITPTINGCAGPDFTYIVTVKPTPIVTSAASDVMCSDVAQSYLITSDVNNTTYSWSRALVAGISNAVVTGQTSNPITETLINTTSSLIGVTYVITPTADGCIGPDFNYNVIVKVTPAPVVSNNSPLCAGTDLNLITPSVVNAFYNWTGPNGFNSAVQNPTIVNSLLQHSGVYGLTITKDGCTSNQGKTNVVVNDIPPAPQVNYNGPLCAGNNLLLTASTIAGASYNWTGPNGFTSTLQNPVLSNATYSHSGKYYVTATVAGCTGIADSSMSVLINDSPQIPTLLSNSPVCTGTDLQITTSSYPGADYSWTGPNGFVSSSQNPTIANAQLLNGGTYKVYVSALGCKNSSSADIVIVVNQMPSTTITTNTPVCEGNTLNLSALTFPGATYNWTGPNGFISNIKDPSISNVATAGEGIYSVTLMAKNCISNPIATSVIIKPLPSIPAVGNNSPICNGGALNFSASTITNAVYSWMGPNGFVASIQSPSISNASINKGGIYYVTTTVDGCTGPAISTVVTVNEIPLPPVLSSNGPLCNGDSLQLKASSVAGANYEWLGPNGFSSSLQNPLIENADVAFSGTYSATITVAGCPSPVSSLVATINAIPSSPIVNNNGPLCEGSTLNLSASTINGASYTWSGPHLFSTNSQNPSINNISLTDTGLYKVRATLNGCTGDEANTVAIVKSHAMANAGTDKTVCANNAVVSIEGTITGGSTTGIWSTNGTGTFTSPNTNLTGTYVPSKADITTGKVILNLTSTNNSVCPASVSPVIINITQVPTVNAGNDQHVCLNRPDVSLNGKITSATGGIWSTTGSGTFSPSNTIANATYIPGAGDISTAAFTLILTTTGNGNCLEVIDSMNVILTPVPSVNAGPDLRILQSEIITLQPVTIDNTLKYLWTPNAYLSNNTLKNPLATGAEDIDYTLTVTDINGCISKDMVHINVLMPFKIPNTFTPNNDGINDTWLIPHLSDYQESHVQVFNRYGQLVFQSKGYAKPWDGTMSGKPIPFGTYYYIIEAGNRRNPITGYVTIIK